MNFKTLTGGGLSFMTSLTADIEPSVGYYVGFYGSLCIFSWVLVNIALFGFYLYYRPSWSKLWHVPLLSIPLAIPFVIHISYFGVGELDRQSELFYAYYIFLLGGGFLSYCLYLFSKIRKANNNKGHMK